MNTTKFTPFWIELFEKVTDFKISISEFLAAVKNIKRLDLENTSVSDLTPIAELTRLKRLDLNNTSVTDLTPLAGLTALEWVNLWNTFVSDLTPLAGLTRLEWLDLRNTRVSEAQVRWLREKLPNTTILF